MVRLVLLPGIIPMYRDVIQQRYKNCTTNPKHVITKYVPRSCPSNCGNWKDNHMGGSTVHGGICPKVDIEGDISASQGLIQAR